RSTLMRSSAASDVYKRQLLDNDISLNTIGNINTLPKKAQKELQEVIAKTAKNKGLRLTLALSYGAREELIQATREISLKVKNNIISTDEIDESCINKHLYTHDLPEVDLLIRTSGEQRVSNFLLWQIAYAEFYFTDVLWPDFTKAHLHDAIYNYQKRERRFGKTSEQLN
ncbi:MAG: di-trans,poly-cis-decaprenylcistransferase, partial [Dokdonia sp.]|nr:di-trans,poly-cis-decaprenylcistransferase [Dokdonia sp.]